jgi:hypothetical protein
MLRVSLFLGVAALSAILLIGSALAHAPSGAIFTTVADGSEVNLNLFPSKEAVYLDGGPGPGAPQHAAGLDDGRYVFQVTDPSGKVLLSTDEANCRQFDVAAGIIVAVVPTGCQHVTDADIDHPPARTVQLMPYENTPNHGGVYKVWVTRVEDFLLGCSQLGVANGLEVVDCGGKTGGNAHGFIPSHSKTDNFKVKLQRNITEIDVHFFNDRDGSGHQESGEELLPGLKAIWIDTLGVENAKYSYMNGGHIEAHIEAVEPGTHHVRVENQPGCTAGLVHVNDIDQAVGPQTVALTFPDRWRDDLTIYVLVACTP